MQFPALLPLGRQPVLVLVSPDDQVEEVVQELHRDVALGAVPGAVLVQHEHAEPALRVLLGPQHQELKHGEGSHEDGAETGAERGYENKLRWPRQIQTKRTLSSGRKP